MTARHEQIIHLSFPLSLLCSFSYYSNHRIIEYMGMEGTFKGPLVEPLCNEQGHLQLVEVVQSLSNLISNVSRVGASTTSLGNLIQCFTTLNVNNFFLISSLNLLSFSLQTSPLSYHNRPC